MFRHCSWLSVCCAVLAVPSVDAAAPHRQGPKYPGSGQLTDKIDRHLEAAWKKANVVPAAPADDPQWLRRVYLDLAGRIPSVGETRDFLADRRSDRRERLVEKLLEGPRYVSHFAAVWSALLLPEAAANIQVRFQANVFERRIQDWLRSGKGIDRFTRDLLTASIGGNQGIQDFYTGGSSGLAAYYAGKDYKPEEIASAVSRVFLGVNIGCAQCHNHPFAEWNRDQFWKFAAFFSGIRSNRMGDFSFAEAEKADDHQLTIPGTDRKVFATYFDGKRADISAGGNTRKTLADWVVARDNPYFARAIVNRTWAYFFGLGLQEPIDEMAGSNSEPFHPEVLDELARGFAGHDFDLRWLMKTITLTRAYGLSSRRSHASQDDPTRFARASLRGLSGQQLFDSLAQATGYRESADPTMGFNPFNPSTRGRFVSKFANTTDKPTEVQTSILQALTLMNGKLTAESTSLDKSETLAAVVDAPFLSLPGKIETLYLAALSRRPTAREVSRMTAYVEKAGAAQPTALAETERDRRNAEALADVFWALLNSGEFYLNH